MNKLSLLFQKIYRHFFPRPQTPRELVVAQWEEDNRTRNLRLIYDLTPEDVVWDVGGYEGQWASDLFAKYQPTIHIFEPVASFADNIAERFAKNPKMHVHRYGISDQDSTQAISLVGDRASTFVQDQTSEQATFRSASVVATELGAPTLIKLNIEGGEYPLLEDLIKSGTIKDITHIQVQFHDFVPDAVARMEAIQNELAKTHVRAYHYPFVWESWTKHDKAQD